MSQTPQLLAPPRGMRDFYPEEMSSRRALFDAWRKAADRAGFEEYDACVVESLSLLKRKAGEEIVEQIYAFQDKSGRDLALRPEMTPTLARMVAAREGSLCFPLKWFAIAQCFRYERMTRGRKREHYQWNLDVIGEPSAAAEAEVLSTAVEAMSLLGLNKSNYRIHYSSRALLSDLLANLGIDQCHHQATFLALDKRGKLDDDAIRDLLRKEEVDETTIDAVFDLKRIETLDQVESLIGGDTPSFRNIAAFLDNLAAYGIADLLSFDVAVIRGLSYYTGIVFEAFDLNREFRAIFGGGRYDNLLGDVGGKPTSGVGLGFGDVVVAEILSEFEAPPRQAREVDLLVGFMESGQQNTAIAVARSIRESGENVDLALHPEKARQFFSRAGKTAASKAIYIGPDDLRKETIRIKALADRSQKEVALDKLLSEPGKQDL